MLFRSKMTTFGDNWKVLEVGCLGTERDTHASSLSFFLSLSLSFPHHHPQTHKLSLSLPPVPPFFLPSHLSLLFVSGHFKAPTWFGPPGFTDDEQTEAAQTQSQNFSAKSNTYNLYCLVLLLILTLDKMRMADYAQACFFLGAIRFCFSHHILSLCLHFI